MADIYMRDYMREKTRRARRWLLEQLGERCRDCGSEHQDDLLITYKDINMRGIGRLYSLGEERLRQNLPDLVCLCRVCFYERRKAAGLTHHKHDYRYVASPFETALAENYWKLNMGVK